MHALQLNIRKQEAPLTGERRLSVFIAGATGRVGSALCRQVAALGVEGPNVVGVANSRRTLLSPRGVNAEELACAGERTEWISALMRLDATRLRYLMFVDCTASAEVASLYPTLLERGLGIATANKIASSSPIAQWRRLRAIASSRGLPLLHETTVGAALPLLRSVRDLVATGDEVIELQAVLSGSLSFILGRLHEGVSFSDAVADAIDCGFTEPDPTIDLGGVDVARKLVILLREAGIDADLGDIALEPLVPPRIRFDDRDSFVRQVRPFDGEWRPRVDWARGEGRRLVFTASFANGIPRVGLSELAVGDVLANLRPGENALVLRTRRYDSVPLTIAGPGAGPEVTAAGLLAEILSAGPWSG